ncbi:OpgC family protein [Falsiroseomonas selenitidurans]|uniref:OpgC domain-containing protein n=1 Tax=Falsiroseomonas selenitidurans TaxID=2716335 RepID=A0ABX1DY74_9PROT|nr:OpgC domain-containing protein [Falsiroseomonas selenitidurans]NKC29831.1 OpgC domain-containing protein [Falsiroseomonas selenitidurans]
MNPPPAAPVRPARDIRVDFLRGLALWFIFITHTPGNLLAHATLRNVAFCDATEVFVLLAGYAAGIAYGRMLEREGWLAAAARLVGRMGTLYVAHIFLFVVFAAQVGFSAAALNQAAYLDELHLDPFGNEPYRALLEALLLRYQPHFLDILPLYIVVLGLFALALPLIRRPAWLLGLSVALYAVTRATGLGLPSWTGSGWFFNPFAWQLLFVIGVLLGRAEPARLLRRFPWQRGLALLAGALLLAAAASLNLVWHGPGFGVQAPEWMGAALSRVDKAALHPVRLASVLLLCWLVGHLIPRNAAWLGHPLAAVFVMMGQQGLPVFCSGIFLSFLGRLALESASGPLAQVAVNVTGLAALIAVAVVSAWYGGEAKRKLTPALPAAAAPARP